MGYIGVITHLLTIDPNFLGHPSRWWFQRFHIFTPNLGEMIQFDEHIFQMGWFNHQLEQLKCLRGKNEFTGEGETTKAHHFFLPVKRQKHLPENTHVNLPGCNWMNLASAKFWIPKNQWHFQTKVPHSNLSTLAWKIVCANCIWSFVFF